MEKTYSLCHAINGKKRLKHKHLPNVVSNLKPERHQQCRRLKCYAYISNVFIMEMRNNELCNIHDAFSVCRIKKLKILLYVCNLVTDNWPVLHIWSHLSHTKVPSTICCVSINASSCFRMFTFCLDNWSIENYGNWSVLAQWLEDCGLESSVCEMWIFSVTSFHHIQQQLTVFWSCSYKWWALLKLILTVLLWPVMSHTDTFELLRALCSLPSISILLPELELNTFYRSPSCFVLYILHLIFSLVCHLQYIMQVLLCLFVSF
jgi:hypothetical protein